MSGLSYGGPTKWVFVDPISGAKLYQSKPIADLNGALAGEQIDIEVERNADDASNTTTSNATGILLSIAIPVTE